MKKIFIYITCLIVGSLFTACDIETTEDVSFVTNYAVFEFESVVAIPLGGTFSPAATASENGVDLPVTTTESVNTNIVGIYDVAYSAANSDGFVASAFQTVVVHDPNIVGTDVSGNIQDAGNPARTGVISLIGGTTSIFLSSDFGFGGTFPVYFQMDGDVISEIPQTYVFGATSVALTYDPGAMIFTTSIQPYGFDYTFEYQ